MYLYVSEYRLIAFKGSQDALPVPSGDGIKEGLCKLESFDIVSDQVKSRIGKSADKVQKNPKEAVDSLAKLKEGRIIPPKAERNSVGSTPDAIETHSIKPAEDPSALGPPEVSRQKPSDSQPVAVPGREPVIPVDASRVPAEASESPERVQAFLRSAPGVRAQLEAKIKELSVPNAPPQAAAALQTFQSMLNLLVSHVGTFSRPVTERSSDALGTLPDAEADLREITAALSQTPPEAGGAEQLRKQVQEFETRLRSGANIPPEDIQAIQGLLQALIEECGPGSAEAARFQSLLQLLPLIQSGEQIAEQRQQTEKAVRELYARYSGYGPIEAAERNVELARQDRNETRLNPIARLSGTHAGRQATLDADQQRVDRLNGLRTQLIAERASLLDTNTNPAQRLLRLQSLIRAADNVNYAGADAELTSAIASLDRTDRVIRTVAEFVPGGSLGVAIAEVRMNPGPDSYKRLAGSIASTALDVVPVGRLANVASRLGRAGGPAAHFVLSTGVSTAQVTLENPNATGQDYVLATVNAATKSRMERVRSRSRPGSVA
jgi:hypothetical protein